MKKFLAVLVVFALVAGAVFADVGIGGELSYRVDLAKGDSDHDDTINAETVPVGTRLDANFGGDDFGGRLRFFAAGIGAPGWWGRYPFGTIWWKPVEQFKIQVGNDFDGQWGVGSTGWGFNAQAQDFVANDKDNGGYNLVSADTRGIGMYPGYTGPGLWFSIYPVEAVTINFGLPFPQGNATELYKVLGHINANVAFNIGDVGNALVGFVGEDGMYDDNKASAGNIYAYFNLTAVENLGLDLGIDFPLPFKNASDVTEAPGLKIGLGASYAAGDFGVKLRVGVELPASVDNEVADGTLTKLGFTLLPYVGLLDGKMTAYLQAGLGLGAPKGDGDSAVDWYVNPYIKVPAGGLTFYAGFKLQGQNDPSIALATIGNAAAGYGKYSTSTTVWSLPIGFLVYF